MGPPGVSGEGSCAAYSCQDNRILLGFWRGQRLSAIEPSLKPGGKYEMATLELRKGMTVASATVRRLTQEAVGLNKKLGDPTLAAKRDRTGSG